MEAEKQQTEAASTEQANVVSTETPVTSTEVQETHFPAAGDEQRIELPEKLQGKSLKEIGEVFKSSENLRGKIAQENGELKKRLMELETTVQGIQQQPVQTQPVQERKTVDQQYDELWEADPKVAVQSYVNNAIGTVAQQQQYNQTVSYYEQLKSGQVKGKEDFSKLEPEMIKVAQELSPYIKPELALHPKTIDYVYEVTKSRTSTGREKEFSSATKRAAQKIEEKELAFMESSSGNSPDEVDFRTLSQEEMRKQLPKAPVEG